MVLPTSASICGITVAGGGRHRIARHRLDMGDELAALGVANGGGEGDLDAEFVRPLGLALADAFDFRRLQE
jgi:hypothetical protein